MEESLDVEAPSITYAPISFSLGLGLGTAPEAQPANALLSPLLAFNPHQQSSFFRGAEEPARNLDLQSPQLLRSRVEAAPIPDEAENVDPDLPEVIEMDLSDDDEQTRPESPGEFIEMPPLPESAAAPSTDSQPPLKSDKEIANLGRRPYWMRWCKNIKSPFLRLHQEIVELVELLQPTEEEVANRREAVEEVTAAVRSIFPSAQIQVFGSFATGLFVPTSDVDLVIINSNCHDVPSGLRALATTLMRKEVAKSVQVIASARVPIIKFETLKFGGLAFDVSFDVANGPEAAALVREFVGDWPMMRPLVLVLKLFLQQRELNEVYTGGIGSYALITLVAAFLRLHTSRKPKPSRSQTPGPEGKRSRSGKGGAEPAGLLEPSLGVLLVDFFRLFGRVINMPEIGVSAMGDNASDCGRFFRKDAKPDGGKSFSGWLNTERPSLLSVEDPKDANNDVTRNSYNVRHVKAAFDFAYLQLTAPCRPEDSRLARILRLGAILISRKPPTNARDFYLKPPPSFTSDKDTDDKDKGGASGSGASGAGGGSGKAKGDSHSQGGSKRERRDRDDRGGDGGREEPKRRKHSGGAHGDVGALVVICGMQEGSGSGDECGGLKISSSSSTAVLRSQAGIGLAASPRHAATTTAGSPQPVMGLAEAGPPDMAASPAPPAPGAAAATAAAGRGASDFTATGTSAAAAAVSLNTATLVSGAVPAAVPRARVAVKPGETTDGPQAASMALGAVGEAGKAQAVEAAVPGDGATGAAGMPSTVSVAATTTKAPAAIPAQAKAARAPLFCPLIPMRRRPAAAAAAERAAVASVKRAFAATV